MFMPQPVPSRTHPEAVLQLLPWPHLGRQETHGVGTGEDGRRGGTQSERVGSPGAPFQHRSLYLALMNRDRLSCALSSRQGVEVTLSLLATLSPPDHTRFPATDSEEISEAVSTWERPGPVHGDFNVPV